MLNKTVYNSESKVVAMTQVIEKTISPDKVTEMYDKVREQVEKDILRTIVIKDNKCEGVVMEMRDEYNTMQKRLMYRFSLNGKEYIDNEVYEEQITYTESQIADKLFERFRNVLGTSLLKESTKLFLKPRV